MTEKEALKLALEALKRATNYDPVIARAITAIKEALAEQDSKDKEQAKTDSFVRQLDEALAQPEQEPVTVPENKKLILVDSSFDDLMYWLERCESKGHLENCSDLIEPWEKFCDSYCVWTDHHPDCKLAQRTWVGLTDEEIDTIGATIFKAEFLDDTEVKSNRELARAIEAAHGIKGKTHDAAN